MAALLGIAAGLKAADAYPLDIDPERVTRDQLLESCHFELPREIRTLPCSS